LKPKNSKQAIEYETAVAFLRLYNEMFQTDYKVMELSDIPDVICRDRSTNEELYLEITLYEDVKGEISFLLGKTKEKPKNHPMSRFGETKEDEALFSLMESIDKKLLKDYGKQVALVVRHMSSKSWDQNIEQVQRLLDLQDTPFDRGIWMLTSDLKILRLD
jgi:hypothetical protein